MRGLWGLLKKDLHLMKSGKFFVLAGLSLLLFSLYINYIFGKLETELPVMAVFDPLGRLEEEIHDRQDVVFLPSVGALYEIMEKGGANIGLDLSGEPPRLIRNSSDPRNNALALAYARSVLRGEKEAPAITYLGEIDRRMKKRLVMTNEVLFFQISTIGFLGIASLLYKEKSMGVLQVSSVLPVRRGAFILSKSLTFLFSDLLFAAALIVINLGLVYFAPVFLRALPHIVILSVTMGLLGLFFSLLCRDFKQFAVPFTFIVLVMIIPVFLADNAVLDWKWLRYYPLYHLFMGLKKAFFGLWTSSPLYYAAAFFFIGILVCGVWYRIGTELSRG